MATLISGVKRFVRKLDSFSPWPKLYSWAMTNAERTLFDRTVKNSKQYLEFGSGGSTLRILEKSNATVYSVESSADWIQFLRTYFFVRRHEGKRLTFFPIDIGKTKEWGHPEDDTAKHLFPSYSSAFFDSIDPKKLDVILVDGRFRVACVLSTILHTYSSDHNNQIIMIHDFWQREYYHDVLNYLEVIDKVDSLGVFKVKDGIDIDLVRKDYDAYKFDSR